MQKRSGIFFILMVVGSAGYACKKNHYKEKGLRWYELISLQQNCLHSHSFLEKEIYDWEHHNFKRVNNTYTYKQYLEKYEYNNNKLMRVQAELKQFKVMYSKLNSKERFLVGEYRQLQETKRNYELALVTIDHYKKLFLPQFLERAYADKEKYESEVIHLKQRISMLKKDLLKVENT